MTDGNASARLAKARVSVVRSVRGTTRTVQSSFLYTGSFKPRMRQWHLERHQKMEFNDWLEVMVERASFGLCLAPGAPPCAAFEGILQPMSHKPLTPREVAKTTH